MNFLNDPPHSPKSHMITWSHGGGDMQRLLGDPSAIFCFVLFFFLATENSQYQPNNKGERAQRMFLQNLT